MPAPQSLSNHARYDPQFHFVLIPLLILNIVFSIYITVRHWPESSHLHLWWIVMSVALLLLASVSRSSALRAQNRIIRLEERLRLMALLPPEEHRYIAELTIPQLIALRFASDEELPALVRQTLTKNLDPKDIKKSISHWRGDYHRV